MSRLWDRVSFRAEGPAVGRSGVAVAEVIRRLEAGEPWALIAKTLGLDLADIVAAIAADGLGDDGSTGPALVQAPPRRPKLLAALGEPTIAAAGARSDRAARLALSAGLLQVQDFWDASHTAAQAADDLGERGTSAYWHGIGHRREPDPGNAAYWFRRVGRHPIFEELSRDARAIIGEDATSDAGQLARGWDPLAVAENGPIARSGDFGKTLARRLQRAEMLRLLEASVAALGLA